MSTIDYEAFERAKEKIIGKVHNENGIGTLSEKSTHGILKYYYEPDIDYQEVAVNGYVADICRGGNIIEIQTVGFKRLRDKLTVFLPEYKVKVVHPISVKKHLNEIDVTTGEIVKSRVSPLKHNLYSGFYELYNLRDFIKNENFSVEFVLFETDEYRVKNAGEFKNKKCRKNTVKYDTVPRSILDIVTFENPKDYLMLIPLELGDSFYAKDFEAVSKCKMLYTYSVLNTLMEIGLLSRKKEGRKYRYYVEEF